MATVYHRDQPGAPGLVYSANAQAGFTALKTILKACLVDGYAARPAAGWDLVNEGGNFLVLRNGRQNGFVCFNCVASVTRVYLADTYTGMAGDIITGAGLKSGVAAGSGMPQAVLHQYTAGYSTSSTWVVVADDKTAVLAVFSDSTASNRALTGDPYRTASYTLCFGEDSGGHLICAGGALTTQTSINAAAQASSLPPDGGFTALKDPSTGLLVGSNALTLSMLGTVTTFTTAQALAMTSAAYAASGELHEVSLVPISWQVGGVNAGRLRGIALCPEVQSMCYPSLAAQYLGRATPMYVRDGNQPIDLGDGHSYFVRAGDYLSAFWLITDNPEFW